MIAIFPEVTACVKTGDVERLAILVRRYFGGKSVFAAELPVAPLLANAGLLHRSLELEGLGALVAKDEQGSFAITALTSHRAGPLQTRFLLAHMFGHYLFDIQPLIARGEWQASGYREAACPLQRYTAGGAPARLQGAEGQREARADTFAAALLLPRAMVTRALTKLKDEGRVATFFGVTRPCLQRRLAEIGLTTSTPANFLEAESQIGADVPVPAETSKPLPDQPTTMPRSYAASTYGAVGRATQVERPEAPVRPGGMERLRELARKLDKTKPQGT